MAKSLRSKWRRKCRAVKRERYGKKELEILKKTLGIDESAPKDAEMSEISDIATVTDAKSIKEKTQAEDEGGQMEIEGARVYNKKTMLDQYGNYPVWMNKRKVEKIKKGRDLKNLKKGKKSKKAAVKSSKRLTRRDKKQLTKGSKESDETMLE